MHTMYNISFLVLILYYSFLKYTIWGNSERVHSISTYCLFNFL